MTKTPNLDFETIYRATFKTVSKYVFFKVAQASDAEDIVQSVYTDFYKYVILKDKHPDNLTGYLIRMADHALADYYQRRSEQTLTFDDESLNVIENLADETDVEEEVFRKSEIAEIMKAIGKLAIMDQKILAAKFRYDMTFLQIAEVLDLSENTVKTRYYRALAKLKSFLTQE